MIAAALADGDHLLSGERVIIPGLSIAYGVRNVYVNFDGTVCALPKWHN